MTDGIDIGVRDGRIAGVRAHAADRVNRGPLDVKDRYGWQANHHPDRLTTPLVRDGDRLVEADWDTAMDRIVTRSRELLARPGAAETGLQLAWLRTRMKQAAPQALVVAE